MLFHRTSAADKILAHGFEDGSGSYLFDVDEPLFGVWLSDVPLDGSEGAFGEQLLVVKIDGRRIRSYEIREEGKPYREWLLPANFLNEIASARLADEADEERGLRKRWGV